MEQYVKGFQRFHAGEDVRPVTSALASFYHLFQVYYKVRQVLLQSATGITKCDNFITKCDRYYKVRRLLQSATVQTHLIKQKTITRTSKDLIYMHDTMSQK